MTGCSGVSRTNAEFLLCSDPAVPHDQPPFQFSFGSLRSLIGLPPDPSTDLDLAYLEVTLNSSDPTAHLFIDVDLLPGGLGAGVPRPRPIDEWLADHGAPGAVAFLPPTYEHSRALHADKSADVTGLERLAKM